MSVELELECGTVTMRTPKVRDLRAVSSIKDKTEQDVRMFANLCAMSPQEIDELSLKDFMALQEAFGSFLS